MSANACDMLPDGTLYAAGTCGVYSAGYGYGYASPSVRKYTPDVSPIWNATLGVPDDDIHGSFTRVRALEGSGVIAMGEWETSGQIQSRKLIRLR